MRDTDSLYKVYPSGFLGSDKSPTTKPLDLERIKDRLFNLSTITNPDAHTANLEVTKLWESVISGAPEYKTFEFKERILKAAIDVFDSDTIYTWIKAQRISPYFNEYHVRWIDETLEYVFANKQRELSYSNWIALLQMTSGGGIKEDTAIIKQFIFNQPIRGYRHQIVAKGTPNMLMSDFITQWVSIKGGIDDLVASLHVLFGSR